MNRIVFLLVFLLTLQVAGLCQAADVNVEQGLNGVFYINGVNFEDVGGVELEIAYDTTALANPKITAGEKLASTTFMANSNFAKNKVKIAAMTLSPINGSGVLAIISFDLKGTAPGSVAVTKKRLPKLDTTAKTGGGDSGKSDPPKDPNKDTKDTANNDTNQNTTTPGTSTNLAGISMGTITLPQDQTSGTTTSEKKTEYQPLVTDLRKDMTLPLPGATPPQGGDSAVTPAEAKAADLSSAAYKSVLQMFKEFKGERNDKSLVALFADAVYPGLKQEPPIALADGVKTVKLTLKLKPSGNESPKFIMQGANVQHLRGDADEYIWIVEAVPRKGVTEANLTVIDGKRTLVFPLIVVPPVDTAMSGGGKTTAADFARYLTKPAKYDLNKDGKFDYVDDYIYTANYIVAMKIKPEKQLLKTGKEPAKSDNKEGQKAAPARQAVPKSGATDTSSEKNGADNARGTTGDSMKPGGGIPSPKQKEEDKQGEKKLVN
jgi:hypothetical protein